jgi:hypothetical protein
MATDFTTIRADQKAEDAPPSYDVPSPVDEHSPPLPTRHHITKPDSMDGLLESKVAFLMYAENLEREIAHDVIRYITKGTSEMKDIRNIIQPQNGSPLQLFYEGLLSANDFDGSTASIRDRIAVQCIKGTPDRALALMLFYLLVICGPKGTQKKAEM